MQLLMFIFGLASLIFLHEVGHFVAARLLKVKSDEFGIGFPPRMFGTAHDRSGKRRWFGMRTPEDIDPEDMILSFNWIPLGGFVRLRGETDPGVPGGLSSASPWVRLAVMAAGPFVNLVVGVILAVILFQTYGARIQSKVILYEVTPGTPAEQVGLQVNDLVVSFNGEPVDSIDKLSNLTRQHLGEEVQIVVQRDGKLLTFAITPRTEWPEGQGPMGVTLSNPVEQLSLLQSISYGVNTSVQSMRDLLLLPVRVIQGTVSAQEVRPVGYKGMYDIYQEVQNPLWFFTVISISLGVMNLLPIPALDGGRILLTLPEILFHRRVPQEYENTLHMIGFILLLLLLVYINVQDFINPIKLP
jgi:regulator of sigma E protease